jgi:ABC-type nitrate/sulfonate/bicarbonate transport system substrate-binding protein
MNNGSKIAVAVILVVALVVGGYRYLSNEAPPHRSDVKELALGEVLDVPYILWGGDVATFHANGGETTAPGSLFHKHGLKLRLTRGDNFDEQVKNYKDGKCAFLRGTMSMLGQVSEDLGGDERTHPVVFLQLTWSRGDHLVSRGSLSTLNDLKGKKIALQKGGPHVGMLNDILHTAQYKWSDVKVEWTDDVTGDKGPAERMRQDPSIDACFVITPDMEALTGGLEKRGIGEGKTIKDAKVLVSTAQMVRSIADVYACRKDYFDRHRDVVEKFTAGYLKAGEELMALKKEGKDQFAPGYKQALGLARKLYGKDVPDDATADGLVSDALFVGLPGNYSFFKDKGNLSGFDAKQKAALDLAVSLGDAKKRIDLLQADLDYGKVKSLGDLSAVVQAPPTARFSDNPRERNTLYSFSVHFEGGRSDFPEAQYGPHFQRAVEQASLFGNAMVSIRGHANAQEMVWIFRDTVLKRGIVTQKGDKFFLKDGNEFPMNEMRAIVALIEKEGLGDVRFHAQGELGQQTLASYLKVLQDLSEKRAASVRRAIIDYAQRHGYRLDESQMKSFGVGGLEPVVTFPKRNDYQEGGKNRRVEFRIIQVAAESITEAEF